MKKRIIITFLLLISVGLLMSDMNFGIGLDFPGTHEFSATEEGMSSSISFDSNMGFEIFSEYIAPLSKSPGMNFEGGFGAAYLLSRGVDTGTDEYDATFGFIPLYFLAHL